MQDTSTNNDPQKKYWWLLLIVLPVLLALIALIPDLLNQEETKQSADTNTPGMTQKTENLEQTTENGHNFSNVQGDINITESDGEDEKKP